MDLLYNLLKLASLLATGAFGILALVTKYEDDQGGITRWGKIAIGGIVVSSGISLALYALEASRAKETADRATAEAEVTKRHLEQLEAKAIETAKQQKRSLEET